jgi:hypothetical protein
MITIDAEAMQKGLFDMLLAECITLTDWLWDQVNQLAPPEVRRDMIEKEVIKMGGQVVGTVAAGGMMALVTEWGSGSLADTSNPAWDEYVRSEYWNPARDPARHTIRGRPKGEYKNLDDAIRYSTGNWEGINLEWKYPPIPPQHWMQGILDRSRPYILERLAQAVQMFPFHKYIHDGR